MPDPRDVTVSIFGNRYTLRSEADPGEITALAEGVDARMREVSAAGGAAGADRIAVLVALNLADELAREQHARRADQKTVAEQTGRIVAILNDEVGKQGVEGV